MSDFVHDGWSLYIAIITLASLVACAVLLKMMSTRKMAPGEKPGTTGHVWDEDLQEWHNPLPSVGARGVWMITVRAEPRGVP